MKKEIVAIILLGVISISLIGLGAVGAFMSFNDNQSPVVSPDHTYEVCDCVYCEYKNAVLRNENISDQREGGGGANPLPTESAQ